MAAGRASAREIAAEPIVDTDNFHGALSAIAAAALRYIQI
jgi:hypothetical protein